MCFFFFFSSRRRHTRFSRDWSSDVCSSDLGPGGSFSTVVHPETTTQYRLAWSEVRAGLAKIAVAPRVDATVTSSTIGGAIKPALTGAVVQLQEQSVTA